MDFQVVFAARRVGERRSNARVCDRLGFPEAGPADVCGWSNSNLNQGNDMYTKIAMASLLALMIGACGGGEEAAEAPPPAKDKASEVKSAKQSKAKKAKVKKAKASKASKKQ